MAKAELATFQALPDYSQISSQYEEEEQLFIRSLEIWRTIEAPIQRLA
jgi:hypothetical protein